MIAALVFIALLSLATAPLAVLATRGRFARSRGLLLSLWFACVGVAGIIAGFLARTPFAAVLFEMTEIVGMAGAGFAALYAVSRRPVLLLIPLLATIAVVLATQATALAAVSVGWTTATLIALALVFDTARESPLSQEERSGAVLLLFGYVIVHISQTIQIVIAAELRMMVPLTVGFVAAVLAGLVAFRTTIRRAPRYEKSGLSAAAAGRIFEAVERIMDEHKPFRDPAFDRGMLARMVGEDARSVGEAINRGAGMSFSAYVRKRRVREVERYFLQAENRVVSLEALGLEAGFKSRSAMYEAFAQLHGTTPGERRRVISTG